MNRTSPGKPTKSRGSLCRRLGLPVVGLQRDPLCLLGTSAPGPRRTLCSRGNGLSLHCDRLAPPPQVATECLLASAE